jgi:hypothetical protein
LAVIYNIRYYALLSIGYIKIFVSMNDGTVNECGAVGGMKNGRKTQVLGEICPSASPFVHHKSHMT